MDMVHDVAVAKRMHRNQVKLAALFIFCDYSMKGESCGK